MRRWWIGIAALFVVMVLAACNDPMVRGTMDAEVVAASLEPFASYDWDQRQGLDSEQCEKEDGDLRPASGWIHWVFSTKGDSTSARLVLGGTGSGTYDPGPPEEANTWHFYTPYFDLEGLEATIELFGGDGAHPTQLVISDYCPGDDAPRLEVTKTADATFDRTHDWEIAKSVDPEKIYLYYEDPLATKATWTVDVTYLGYEDDAFAIAGTIDIENVGSVPAVIESVTDDLGIVGYDDIDVACGVTFPHTLAVGDTLTCTYGETFEAKPADSGTNTASVAVEGVEDPFVGTDDWEFGDPANEYHAVVDVVDISDLFGTQDLGTLNAADYDEGDVERFTYDEDFAWADYGQAECGNHRYDNTAQVLSGDDVLDEDDATLKVYVQCLVFEGETAWAANGDTPLEFRYTNRGNWATYVAYAPKTTTLFAGQTIDVGTVTFSTVDGGTIDITVALTGDWEFEDVVENLKVQDYATAPSGNPEPGLFEHKKTCDAEKSTCTIEVPANDFYGVHVNVGTWVPDPNFGP
jgi:hypothetical protein